MVSFSLIVGFVLGLVFPRVWISPLAAIAVMIWVGTSLREEYSWFVGILAGLTVGIAQILGVLTRRWLSSRSRRPRSG